MSGSGLAALAVEIESKMHQALKVTPSIEWVAPGALERSALKTNFFERMYEQTPVGAG